MSQRKEAIALLEEAKHQGCSGHCVDRINQTLAILKAEQLPTKWTVFIEHLELSQKLYCLEYDDRRIANITKDQFESFEALLGKEQPQAGDFTTLTRKRCSGKTYDIPQSEVDWLFEQLSEACDIIDRLEASRERKDEYWIEREKQLEASRKELLTLCEEFMVISDDGSAKFDDPVPGSIYLRAEAAIEKHKQGD